MTGLPTAVVAPLAFVSAQPQTPPAAADAASSAGPAGPASPARCAVTPVAAATVQCVAPLAAPGAPAWTDRRRAFLKRRFSPRAFLETIPGAAFDTAREIPAQWPRTGTGFAKHVGSQYEQFRAGETIELGVSALHHEDPRDCHMPDATSGRRLGHALAATVVGRGADGSRTLGLARAANVYASWAIATSWNPPKQRNVWKIAGKGTLGLGLKAASNLFREFWPDVNHRLRR
jgi:hypothetical protein